MTRLSQPDARERAYWRVLKATFGVGASGTTFDWDWSALAHDRVSVLETLIGAAGATRYLEIGCLDDVCFSPIRAARKVGVDPVRGGTHRMTSDAFFMTLRERFDVVFLDGDHRYGQVRRDLVNALQRLDVGGHVVLHDVLPRAWYEEHVPRLHYQWTGGVWKVAFDLLATEGVTLDVVLVDHGVAVVRKDRASIRLARSPFGRRHVRFRTFARVVHDLPLVTWEAWSRAVRDGA